MRAARDCWNGWVRVLHLGRSLEMIWFLELWVRPKNSIALCQCPILQMIHTWNPILNSQGIYREVLEKEKQDRHHKMLWRRHCDTGSRHTSSMQIHNCIFVFTTLFVFIKHFSKHSQCYDIMLSSATTHEEDRVGFIIPIIRKPQGCIWLSSSHQNQKEDSDPQIC